MEATIKAPIMESRMETTIMGYIGVILGIKNAQISQQN